MSTIKFFIGALILLSVFSSVSFAAVGYCRDFSCVGGPGAGNPCTTNTDCNLVPIEQKDSEGSLDTLYADIALGVMGVATAAIVTLVGFTIYAKGATQNAKRTRSRRRR